MPFFMVDDQLHVNQKTQALIDLGQLGLAALGLWTVVGSKVQAQGSDGQVLPSSWRLVGDKRLFIKLAGVLVDVGLWENERDTDDAGWQYHDWFDIGYSPAEKVKLNRKRTKEMKNPDIVNAVKARDGDRCRYCGHKVDWKNRTGDYGATYDHVTPGLAAGVGNLVVACRKCNRQKAQRTPDQAGMPLLPPPNGPDSAAADGTRSGPENLVPDQVSDQVSDQKPASPLKAGNRSGPGSGPGEQRGDDEVTAGVAGPAGRPPDISPSPGHTGSPWHGHRGPPPNVDEPRCPIHNLDMPCRKCTADHYSDEVSP